MTKNPSDQPTDEKPTELSGDIAELVRFGGPRPKMDANSVSRMQEALRPLWMDEVRSNAPSRTWFFLAAAIVVMGIATTLFYRTNVVTRGESFATVARLDGAVTAWIDGDGDTAVGVDLGTSLRTGRLLATAEDARVALKTLTGHSLRLDRDTRIALISANSIRLEQGAVYLESAPGLNQSPGLDVLTPLGRVTEIGTQFEVRLRADTLQVRVREGEVSVRAEGLEHQAQFGEELTLSAGVFTKTEIDPFDAVFEWTQSIAPIWEVDGSRLDLFLTWVARENGLSLQYSDADLRKETSGAVLSGEVEGLSPRSALEVVLPTAGLSHKIENGSLWIERIDNNRVN